MFYLEIVEKLKKGEVGIIPTDTLYGLVGSALFPETVERIYALRKRDLDKPMIILIADLSELEKFSITVTSQERTILEKLWPEKISVVLSCPREKFSYLHRETHSLAFRVPKDGPLRAFLRATGPLVAPSANIQSQRPAETIEEARAYFGDQIDFYVDAGKKISEPSTIISLREGKIKLLRRGAFHVDSLRKS